jgi:hypothetical protein
LLSACVLQSQMFFLLGQKATKLALHLFQHIALAVFEPLARGFALWRERGDGSSGLDIAPLKLDRRCKRSAALVFIPTQRLHKMAASL